MMIIPLVKIGVKFSCFNVPYGGRFIKNAVRGT